MSLNLISKFSLCHGEEKAWTGSTAAPGDIRCDKCEPSKSCKQSRKGRIATGKTNIDCEKYKKVFLASSTMSMNLERDEYESAWNEFCTVEEGSLENESYNYTMADDSETQADGNAISGNLTHIKWSFSSPMTLDDDDNVCGIEKMKVQSAPSVFGFDLSPQNTLNINRA